MKKFYLVFAVAMLALAFASCHKDGQYKPKKQIKSIYKQEVVEYDKPFFSELDHTIDRYLDEKWTWDGKKLKTMDSYYTDGSLYAAIQLTYDSKDRFDRIIYPSYQLQFRYDGSNLAGIDVYSGTSIDQSYTFTYDGKHVSRVDMVNYNNSNKNIEELRKNNPLSLLFGKEIADNMMSIVNTKKTRGMTSGSYTLTWKGNNVSSISGTVTSSSATTSTTQEYEYDSHKNPIYGFYQGFSASYMSENNITSVRTTITQGTIRIDENTTINYTYGGDYPQMATKVHHGVDTEYYWYYPYNDSNPDYYPSYTSTLITEYQY